MKPNNGELKFAIFIENCSSVRVWRILKKIMRPEHVQQVFPMHHLYNIYNKRYVPTFIVRCKNICKLIG